MRWSIETILILAEYLHHVKLLGYEITQKKTSQMHKGSSTLHALLVNDFI